MFSMSEAVVSLPRSTKRKKIRLRKKKFLGQKILQSIKSITKTYSNAHDRIISQVSQLLSKGCESLKLGVKPVWGYFFPQDLFPKEISRETNSKAPHL